MDLTDNDRIAALAYARWEREGRPEGRDHEFWLAAEADLRTEREARNKSAGDATRPGAGASWVLSEGSAAKLNAAADSFSSPSFSLPSTERVRARAARTGGGRRPKPVPPAAVEHFVVVADRRHVRFYRVMTAEGAHTQFELAEAFGLSARRPASAGTSGLLRQFSRDEEEGGESAAERGSGRDSERAVIAEVAEHIDRFFLDQEQATWDFAAGPALHQPVLNRLGLSIRRRLGRTVVKELVHQTPQQLREHFALASSF